MVMVTRMKVRVAFSSGQVNVAELLPLAGAVELGRLVQLPGMVCRPDSQITMWTRPPARSTET
jgi:hypothetical protein